MIQLSVLDKAKELFNVNKINPYSHKEVWNFRDPPAWFYTNAKELRDFHFWEELEERAKRKGANSVKCVEEIKGEDGKNFRGISGYLITGYPGIHATIDSGCTKEPKESMYSFCNVFVGEALYNDAGLDVIAGNEHYIDAKGMKSKGEKIKGFDNVTPGDIIVWSTDKTLSNFHMAVIKEKLNSGKIAIYDTWIKDPDKKISFNGIGSYKNPFVRRF